MEEPPHLPVVQVGPSFQKFRALSYYKSPILANSTIAIMIGYYFEILREISTFISHSLYSKGHRHPHSLRKGISCLLS